MRPKKIKLGFILNSIVTDIAGRLRQIATVDLTDLRLKAARQQKETAKT